jgi:aminopeptidase N
MSRITFLVLTFSFSAFSLFHASCCHAQNDGGNMGFTHADTLRGTITPERAWWNVLRYDISVTPDYTKKTIRGTTGITFQTLQPGNVLQLDLQEPMQITSIRWRNITLKFKREGNAFHVQFPSTIAQGHQENLLVSFEGKPREAVRPPWDGGWIWTTDQLGRPWMTVACQGLGASVWYPCKDHQSDEPDSGASLRITVPDTLVAVGNGRLKNKENNGNGTTTYTWAVVNPINNYTIIPYIGKYVTWHEDFPGEKGKLDCDFWVLDYDLDKARVQFKQADSMLHCFEYWMGPYPFYEDSYKLIEAPHLGMEHQSAVAYGNHFQNGYLGRDLSHTGWGLKWDFIIVHESGHEWFANSITSKDIADMWIHEGFTNYSETLYTTCQDGVEAGNDYCIGTRKNIRNDKPIIGAYGVNDEGSGDMYYKGGNMIHMIRQIVGSDTAFRGLLRGLNSAFYHQTVTTGQIENYISNYAHKDLSKLFDQYLRTTQIPELEYKQDDKGRIAVRWTNCVKGFNIPIRVSLNGGPLQWITPSENWTTIPNTTTGNGSLSVDRNFYVNVKKLG